MPIIKVNFPPGLGTIVPRSASGGNQNPKPITPDANGQAEVDTEQVLLSDLLQHGCSITPHAVERSLGELTGAHQAMATWRQDIERRLTALEAAAKPSA
jgi:hypothetical protein